MHPQRLLVSLLGVLVAQETIVHAYPHHEPLNARSEHPPGHEATSDLVVRAPPPSRTTSVDVYPPADYSPSGLIGRTITNTMSGVAVATSCYSMLKVALGLWVYSHCGMRQQEFARKWNAFIKAGKKVVDLRNVPSTQGDVESNTQERYNMIMDAVPKDKAVEFMTALKGVWDEINYFTMIVIDGPNAAAARNDKVPVFGAPASTTTTSAAPAATSTQAQIRTSPDTGDTNPDTAANPLRTSTQSSDSQTSSAQASSSQASGSQRSSQGSSTTASNLRPYRLLRPENFVHPISASISTLDTKGKDSAANAGTEDPTTAPTSDSQTKSTEDTTDKTEAKDPTTASSSPQTDTTGDTPTTNAKATDPTSSDSKSTSKSEEKTSMMDRPHPLSKSGGAQVTPAAKPAVQAAVQVPPKAKTRT